MACLIDIGDCSYVRNTFGIRTRDSTMRPMCSMHQVCATMWITPLNVRTDVLALVAAIIPMRGERGTHVSPILPFNGRDMDLVVMRDFTNFWGL